MGNQVHLFVEILNKYLYFFNRGCPSITVKYLKGLIRLINEHIPNLDASDTSRIAKMHYQNTIAYVKEKQGEEFFVDEGGEKPERLEDDGDTEKEKEST